MIWRSSERDRQIGGSCDCWVCMYNVYHIHTKKANRIEVHCAHLQCWGRQPRECALGGQRRDPKAREPGCSDWPLLNAANCLAPSFTWHRCNLLTDWLLGRLDRVGWHSARQHCDLCRSKRRIQTLKHSRASNSLGTSSNNKMDTTRAVMGKDRINLNSYLPS